MNIISGSVFVTIVLASMVMHSVTAHASSTSRGVVRLHVISDSPVSYQVQETALFEQQQSNTTLSAKQSGDLLVPTDTPYVVTVTELERGHLSQNGCSATFHADGTPYTVTSETAAASNSHCSIKKTDQSTVAIVVSDKHS